MRARGLKHLAMVAGSQAAKSRPMRARGLKLIVLVIKVVF